MKVVEIPLLCSWLEATILLERLKADGFQVELTTHEQDGVGGVMGSTSHVLLVHGDDESKIRGLLDDGYVNQLSNEDDGQVVVSWDSSSGDGEQSFDLADVERTEDFTIELIQQLNGQDRTLIAIGAATTYFLVGGDAQRGLVVSFNENDDSLLLQLMTAHPDASGDRIDIVTGGQVADWDPSDVATTAEAIAGAAHYIHHFEPLPGVTWKDQTGKHHTY